MQVLASLGRPDYRFGMSKQAFGGWAWLEDTGGNLTARQRVDMLPPLLRSFQRFSVDRLRLASRAKPPHSLGAEDLWPTLPDSRLCREADAEARDLQSASLVNHGYRTWVFGTSLARIDGVNLDPELFFGAALLHDVGLDHIETDRCFTHRSAVSTRTVAERAGRSEKDALVMMDGIAHHITPGIRLEDSTCGFYLQAGAMVDLAGIRAWELPSELRARTHQTYARNEVHKVVSACWRAEAKAVPAGRASFLDTWGGFSKMVRWFPVEG